MSHIGRSADKPSRPGHTHAPQLGNPAASTGWARLIGVGRQWLTRLAAPALRAGRSLGVFVRQAFVRVVRVMARRRASVGHGTGAVTPAPSTDAGRQPNVRAGSAAAPRRRSGRPAQARSRPRAPDNRIWLDLDERIGRGELVPGAYLDGTFEWPQQSGRSHKISYEADMTDPAGGWLRLWFSINDSATGKRQVNDQYVRMAATREGRWHFIVGQQAARRLYLGPGGKRFKCLAAPRPRRKQRKHWLVWARTARSNRAPKRWTLHIDDLLHHAALVPGELRNGKLELRMGECTLAIRYSSDLFDPNSARLWLYFSIPDGTASRSVGQEVQLAKGDGRWWFKADKRIAVELVLRDGCFVLPNVSRRPAKSPRFLPRQQATASALAAQSPNSARAEIASQPVAPTVGKTPQRKQSSLARTKKKVAQFFARKWARTSRARRTVRRARVRLFDLAAKAWHYALEFKSRLLAPFIGNVEDVQRPTMGRLKPHRLTRWGNRKMYNIEQQSKPKKPTKLKRWHRQ